MKELDIVQININRHLSTPASALRVVIETGKISFDIDLVIGHQSQHAGDPRYHVPEQEADDFQDGDGLVRLDRRGRVGEQFDGIHDLEDTQHNWQDSDRRNTD